MAITVLSQPSCAGCTWVVKTLAAEGLPYVVRDVRTDPEAADLLTGLYATLKPGVHPSTPVTILPDGDVIFGPAIRDRVRHLRREAA
ncbi:glutaredoxin domain-containing protein [Tsukamurella tyrosinosolvens]|uniref:glutaredoxin domain-containing protein n=1 Tax=Tsukamurella tyrosinosolvens TaxID=57704 RepID=UPI000C7EB5D0|nr:glutaredoxin domain-containing protein [Tsukamurella tyrosinosolvens]AUN38650.1 hypothetical protein ASU32_00355 [Tsukamurella tyrosinosolvens]